MMNRTRYRRGLTLLEIMLATVILTVVAVTMLQFTRYPGQRVKQSACDLRVEQLQVLCQQFYADTGRWPSSDLREIVGARYLGSPLPVCPVDGRSYRLNTATGRLSSHGTHGAD
jgi:prepilin-type N-terminal cleavage/methylation domain-containing protein